MSTKKENVAQQAVQTRLKETSKTLRDSFFDKRNTTGLNNANTMGWFYEVLRKFYVLETKKAANNKTLKKKAVMFRSFNGHFIDKNAEKEVFKYLAQFITEPLIKQDFDKSETSELSFLQEGILLVEKPIDDNFVDIKICTTDSKFLKNFEKFLKSRITDRPHDNMGRVYVLASEQSGLVARSLGVAAVGLELENYTEKVQAGIRAVVEDLKSSTPGGRLIVLEGIPGAGKTFCIRSLIKEVPRAFFVVVPPALVSSLGDPSMVPALLGLKSDESENEENEGDPVILIVEDADQAITKRGMDNQSSISSLLNLTSGILGDLLDVRIIATTNAKKADIEPALIRDGRLSVHLHIGKLDEKQAQAVYRRLIGNKNVKYNGDTLLASVYKAARKTKIYKQFTQDLKKKGINSKKHSQKSAMNKRNLNKLLGRDHRRVLRNGGADLIQQGTVSKTGGEAAEEFKIGFQ